MKKLWLSTLITGVVACSGSETAELLGAKEQQSHGSSELGAWFSAFDRVGPGVSYVLVKNGRIIENAAFGYANIQTLAPMTPATPLRTGSVGKTFTALTIAIAEELGSLSYDDSITDYLPQLPGWLDKVSVRHLLNHTSGLPGWDEGYTQELCATDAGDTVTNRDVIAWLVGQPESRFADSGETEIEPGKRFKYSNTGYVLLASIVEAVSGRSYDRFLREHVLVPAGIEAYPAANRGAIPNEPSAYGRYPFFNNMDQYRSGCDGVHGDGGLYISTSDYAKYMLALRNDILVSRETRDTMFTRSRLNTGEENQVGFAWFLDDFAGRSVVNHEGGWGGFSSYVAFFPESDLWFGVSSNYAGIRDQFADGMDDLILRLQPYL